jgi:hypothetical protein
VRRNTRNCDSCAQRLSLASRAIGPKSRGTFRPSQSQKTSVMFPEWRSKANISSLFRSSLFDLHINLGGDACRFWTHPRNSTGASDNGGTQITEAWRSAIDAARRSVVVIQTDKGQGSGFLMKSDGTIARDHVNQGQHREVPTELSSRPRLTDIAFTIPRRRWFL